jgi:hypothetical protein
VPGELPFLPASRQPPPPLRSLARTLTRRRASAIAVRAPRRSRALGDGQRRPLLLVHQAARGGRRPGRGLRATRTVHAGEREGGR